MGRVGLNEVAGFNPDAPFGEDALEDRQRGLGAVGKVEHRPAELPLIFQPLGQRIRQVGGQVGSRGAEDGRVGVFRDLFREEVDLRDEVAVVREDRLEVGGVGPVVVAETGQEDDAYGVGVGQAHDRAGHRLLGGGGLDGAVLLVDVKEVVGGQDLVPFAALEQDVPVGEGLVGIIRREIDVGVDVDIGDVDVVGILGILVDDGIRLVIVLVGAGEVLFGCEDVDFDVLVEAFDIVDRLLGQFEDLVAGQVEADREALDDNRRDDVDQDDRRDKADGEHRRHRAVAEAAGAV